MHTAASLKKEFKAIATAKKHFNLKARGWQALADKLNQASGQEALIAQLQAEIAQLKAENAALKQSTQPDMVGFWLLDENFDRSRFTDFDVPEMAFRSASAAKAFHKRLARKFHPDKGGTAEQMANLNALLDQMFVMVELHGGLAA